MRDDLPIAVLGAGPIGLAAAAHLIERGLTPLVLEASTEVAASVRDWGHVRLFSPWRYNIDKAAARLLEREGWTAPPADELPTGDELYRRYLRPLAEALRPHVATGRRAISITRRDLDKTRTADRDKVPFVIRTVSPDGAITSVVARAVIDATGTWRQPNPIGASGVAALGEDALAGRVHYGIPDVLGRHRDRYAGKTTLVIGAGHSAANSILALAELAKTHPGTAIVWATRGGNLARVFGGGDADGLPARGQLGRELRALVGSGRLETIENLRIDALVVDGAHLAVRGRRGGDDVGRGGIDAIIAATGQRPDHDLARELRLSIDPSLESVTALAPLIDPNEHSCGTVRPHGAIELAHPERDFYIIGSKSYGRAPTFLLATGYEQARSVVAMLAGDRAAATRVELDLPETGVCNSNLVEAATSCCAPGRSSCC